MCPILFLLFKLYIWAMMIVLRGNGEAAAPLNINLYRVALVSGEINNTHHSTTKLLYNSYKAHI